jgi:hypothetical protein
LKIAQSNLTDATASSAFLPVAQILGRLSIKVVDAKWARPPSPAVRR